MDWSMGMGDSTMVLGDYVCTSHEDGLQLQKWRHENFAIWVGIIVHVCAMVPALFIKSKSTLDEDYEPLSLSTIGESSLKEILISAKEAFKIKAI